MRIEWYRFGRVSVGGHEYTSDVVIYPDHVDPSWWRKVGHSLHLEDLSGPLQATPKVIIVGTGYFGAMKVPEEVIASLKELGIIFHMTRTSKAVSLFNALSANQRAVACLHISC